MPNDRRSPLAHSRLCLPPPSPATSASPPPPLGAADARIESSRADDGPLTIDITAGQLDRDCPEIVPILVPFRHRYDDLIHT